MSSNTIDTAALVSTLKEVMMSLARRDKVDLSSRQLGTVLLIYTEDAPQTVRGIAEKLGVSKPAITRAMDKLEEMELALRKIDPTDRRSVLLGRTPKGRTFMRELEKTIRTSHARATAPVAPEAQLRKAA